jgi:hypothetical protein
MKPDDDDELYNLKECERRSTRKVATWRADIRKRRIPYVKLGRLTLIRKSDFQAMIAKGFRPAIGG